MTEPAAVSLGKIPFFFPFGQSDVCNSPQTLITDNSDLILVSRVQHQGVLRAHSSCTMVHTVKGSFFHFAFLFTDGII